MPFSMAFSGGFYRFVCIVLQVEKPHAPGRENDCNYFGCSNRGMIVTTIISAVQPGNPAVATIIQMANIGFLVACGMITEMDNAGVIASGCRYRRRAVVANRYGNTINSAPIT